MCSEVVFLLYISYRSIDLLLLLQMSDVATPLVVGLLSAFFILPRPRFQIRHQITEAKTSGVQ